MGVEDRFNEITIVVHQLERSRIDAICMCQSALETEVTDCLMLPHWSLEIKNTCE